MKKLRVLALVHKHLVPPEDTDRPRRDQRRVEDGVRRHVDARGDRATRCRWRACTTTSAPSARRSRSSSRDIVFNLLEAFADVTTFDQNVVSYLELLRLPYTGCNPRGLMLARDKSLSKKLLAYHRIPVPEFTVVRRGRKAVLPKRLLLPAHREVADVRGVDRHLAGVGRRERRAAAAPRAVRPREPRARRRIVEQFIDGRELYVGVLGNERLQVFPVWEMFFTQMPDNNWRIATERVKWSTKYQKQHGIKTDEAKLPDGRARADPATWRSASTGRST